MDKDKRTQKATGVATMDTNQYKVIVEEIRGISSDIARLDLDLTRDRHELSDFKVQMATLTEEVKQLRKEMTAMKNEVGREVEDSLKPVTKDMNALSKEIKQKKTLIITKNGFMDWIRNRFMKAR